MDGSLNELYMEQQLGANELVYLVPTHGKTMFNVAADA